MGCNCRSKSQGNAEQLEAQKLAEQRRAALTKLREQQAKDQAKKNAEKK